LERSNLYYTLLGPPLRPLVLKAIQRRLGRDTVRIGAHARQDSGWHPGCALRYARRARLRNSARLPTRVCLRGSTGREPFDEAQLEPLAPLDTEPFGPDLTQWTAKEMFPLEGHRYRFE
jgi:hypothetical protein